MMKSQRPDQLTSSYPPDFYYQYRSSEPVYSFQSSGNLSVTRFVNGQAYWIMPDLAFEEKKKSLVFADWTTFNWSQEKFDKIKSILKKYIDDGFIIYIWLNNEVKLFTRDMIDNFEPKNYHMPPTNHAEISKSAASQHHLSIDQILILDDYWLQHMIDKNPVLPARDLNTSELIQARYDWSSIVLMLKSATPKLDKITFDEFSEYHNDKFKNIHEDLEGMPIVFQYRSLKLDYSTTLALLNSGEVTLHGKTINKKDLISLKEIIIYPDKTNDYSLNALQNMFQYANNMEILSFIRFNTSEECNIQDIYLTKLNTLNISSSTLTANSLQPLLTMATRLETLNIIYSDLPDEMDFENVNLSSLKTLNLGNSKLTGNSLKKLLIKTPQLEVLKLNSCNIHNDVDFDGVYLGELKTLSLEENELTSRKLQMIARTPKLETLILSSCKFSEDIDLKNVHLSNLKALDLSNSTLTAARLKQLLMTTPQLESLDLHGCTIIGDIDFEDVHLPNLKQFNLRRSTFTATSLKQLLMKTPQLDAIDFSSCKISGDMDFHGINLPELKSLRMGNITLSIESLRHLLMNAPQLEELHFGKNKFTGEIDFKDMFLPGLKALSFDETGLPTTGLQQLLTKTPNLETVIFSQYLLENIDFQGVTLPKLKELILSFSTLDASSLHKLLSKTPHLKRISLRECTIIGDLNIQDIHFPDISEIQCLSSITGTTENIFSTQSLIDVIKKSPQLETLYIPTHTEIDFNNPELIFLLSRVKNVTRREINRKREAESSQNTPLNATKEDLSSLPDKPYDPMNHLNNEPKKEDYQHRYREDRDALSQNTIINQLCQFISVAQNDEYTKFIPKMNDGICGALSLLFLNTTNLNDWDTFINDIYQWNGKIDTLNHHLRQNFETLLSYFKAFYVNKKDIPEMSYVGDDLKDFLKFNKGSFLLSNPWHAVCVKNLESALFGEDKWLFYDPNSPGGYKILTTPELLTQIRHYSLGPLVFAEKQTGILNTFIKPLISNASEFLQEGGLLALLNCTNRSERNALLAQIETSPLKDYPKDVLQGLLMRSVEGIPAWILCLRDPDPDLKIFTIKLLKQFAEKNKTSYAYLLANSLDGLHGFKKYTAIEDLILASTHHPYILSLCDDVRNALHRKQPLEYLLYNESKWDLKRKPTVEEIQYRKQKIEKYKKEFETWDKSSSSTFSMDIYCQHLVSGKKNKCLIELSSTQAVQSMSLALQHHCQSINRPFIYIDSPEDLVCSSSYIKRHGSTGELKPGPGGKLYDFLIADYDEANPPILIVNYDNFNTNDMVRFNALLDKNPKADGTPLPDCCIVIGVINPDKPGCYQGEDFYSRFGKNGVEICPFSAEQFPTLTPAAIKPLAKQTGSGAKKTVPINLYHAPDWKERLLGRWVIRKDTLHFEEGLLVSALASGLPVEIQNGLWDNASFCQFWEQARALGYVESYGQTIPVSHKVKFVTSEGYEWSRLKECVQFQFEHGLQEGLNTLNPTQFSKYFMGYQCDNSTHLLDTLPGLIAAHEHQSLAVNLTRSLSEDEWGALLIECEKYHVKLLCHCTPSVTLPKDLVISPSAVAQKRIPWGTHTTSPAAIICSTDVDATVAMLTKSDEQWKVIDVSELGINDLLTQTDGKINHERLCFEFTETARVLKHALDKNENVILKGYFSPELADALAQILLKKMAGKMGNGKLILVSEDITNLNCLPAQDHIVTVEEKRTILASQFLNQDLHNLPDEPLCISIAKLSYPASLQDPWQGVKDLPSSIKLDEFDQDNVEKKSKAFIHERLEGVNTILDKSPFVFLTGLTGVGKSTFVEKYLPSGNTRLYKGTQAMHDWAKDQSGQRKILFIDEANISTKQWSEFEGLYNNPPSIVIDGVYYPLTDQHKVVFAGNPLNYGGERRLATFFERHGNALVFKPMPLEFIYQEILKPVFAKTSLEKHALKMSVEILNMYRFLCQCSADEVLISPRELQMMALMATSHLQENPQHDPVHVARHYAFLIGRGLTPEKDHAKLLEIFPAKSTLLRKVKIKNKPVDFTITHSRLPLYQQLNDLIALREYRRSDTKLSDEKKYGGLGGIIIEGDPGIGKSELVSAQLKARGYQEVNLSTQNVPDKAFYFMPVSMPYEEKKKLLLKAFHEGAVVIIDEINSSPMMESLLNDLLMGKNPEKGTCRVLMQKHEPRMQDMSVDDLVAVNEDGQLTLYWIENGKLVNHSFGEAIVSSIAERLPEIGEESKDTKLLQDIISQYGCNIRLDNRPDKPGFMIIGTQNPVTMAGRLAPSNALKRRLITASLPLYHTYEIQEILIARGVPDNTASMMAEAYLNSVEKAKAGNLTPAPSFRDLFRFADKWIERHKPMSDTPALKSRPKKILSEESPASYLLFSSSKQKEMADKNSATKSIKPSGRPNGPRKTQGT